MAATVSSPRGCCASAATGCELALLGGREALKGDAAAAAARWSGPVGPLGDADARRAPTSSSTRCSARASPRRSRRRCAAEIVERVNASGKPVVAVDVPSGIDGDSGAVRGRGDPGHGDGDVLPAEARPSSAARAGPLCGAVRVADIGIPDDVARGDRPRTCRATSRRSWRGLSAAPALTGTNMGAATPSSCPGGVDATGAARLAARAALSIGAGLVTVASPADALASTRRADGRDGARPATAPKGSRRSWRIARATPCARPGRGRRHGDPAMVAAAARGGPRPCPRRRRADELRGDAAALAALIAGRRTGSRRAWSDPSRRRVRQAVQGLRERLRTRFEAGARRDAPPHPSARSSC